MLRQAGRRGWVRLDPRGVLRRVLTTRDAVSADALAGPPAVELEPAGVGVIRDRRGVRAGHDHEIVTVPSPSLVSKQSPLSASHSLPHQSTEIVTLD